MTDDAGWAQIGGRFGPRPDGVMHYRYRTSDGAVNEVHSHASNHLPYYHFGKSDDLIQPPPYDVTLQEPRL